MNRLNTLQRTLVLALLALLALSACGTDDGDDEPLPTQVSMDQLATERATQTVDAAPPGTDTSTDTPTATPSETPTITPTSESTPTPQVTLTPQATPTPKATQTPQATPTASPTPSLTPTATFSPTPGAATETAQANATATERAAGALPVTQTAAAVRQRTATVAAAAITPTTTTTAIQSPPPDSESVYQVVFYTDRHGSDDIYLLALDGTEYRITGSAANEREPSCAPDGRSLVYASDATGTWQIYWQPLAGTSPVQLTDSEGMNFAPRFSPDGSQIVFVSTRADGIPTIWLMNADGSNQRQITTLIGRDTTPAWSRDGRQLLFSSEQYGPWDLFITVLGENVEGEFPLMPPEFNEGNQLWPSFDPTGDRVAYSSWENINDPQSADIYLLDFEQPAPAALRAEDGADIAWSWYDDTRLLVSVGGPDDVQIALMDLATGDLTELTSTGPFNGGAQPCPVASDSLPPEPTVAPSPTPSATPTATDTPTPQPTPTVSAFSPQLLAAAGHKHVVQPGDTLMRIGYTYGVNWEALATLNTLTNPDRLSIGQRITVPVTRVGRRIGGLQHPDSDVEVRMAVRKEIVVELDEQIVRAYEDGRLVKTVSVSTGLPQTPTVKGEYSIYHKTDAQTMSGPDYYLPGVPWVMYFYKGYGLHGTYWHDNFGQPMSHGCVNLRTPDAKWFYDWAQIGTPVLVKQ